MKLIKTYAVTLVLSYIFVFFGGWKLFDFSNRFWLATAACALIIAAVITLFIEQSGKIEQLEKRVGELEKKSDSAQ